MTGKTQSRLRILQVGMGGWGRDWAQQVIPAVDEVELVACVDTDRRALVQFRNEVPVPALRSFTSLEQGLKATQPEAVLITAALPGHVPLARAALEAGKHVLIEKPFAPDLASARELVELAAAKDRALMVSQNYRFFPAARAAARLVEEASLGRLHEISIDFRRYSRVGPNGPDRHHTEDQPLLVDMSIHHFDLLRLVLGREPKRIYCEAWNPGWSGFSGPSAAVASILFEGGVVVSYRGSWISAGPITPWAGEWRMEFEGGEVVWTSRGDYGAQPDRVVVRPLQGKPKALTLPKMARIDRWGTLAEFANSIRSGGEPETSGRDNLGTIALMAAAVESAQGHKPVQLSGPRQLSRA